MMTTPLCHICGQPLKLIDVVALARSSGLNVPDDPYGYQITCCGYDIVIDDDELANKIIDTLLGRVEQQQQQQ